MVSGPASIAVNGSCRSNDLFSPRGSDGQVVGYRVVHGVQPTTKKQTAAALIIERIADRPGGRVPVNS
jgi:hypothetical protein